MRGAAADRCGRPCDVNIRIGNCCRRPVVQSDARTGSDNFDYRFVSKLPSVAIPACSTADARLAWMIDSPIELSAAGEKLSQPFHYEFPSDPGPNVAIKRGFYGRIVWTGRPQ